MFKNIMLALSLTIFLLSSANAKEASNTAYLSVTDFDFTMSGKPSVSISFGKSIEDYYTVTIYKDKIKANTTIIRDKKHPKKVINATATLEAKNYQFSLYKNSNSMIVVKFKTIDYKRREAFMDVSLRLVDVPTQKYVTVDKHDIKIDGKSFDNLVQK